MYRQKSEQIEIGANSFILFLLSLEHPNFIKMTFALKELSALKVNIILENTLSRKFT
jgi:hypothetical protein